MVDGKRPPIRYSSGATISEVEAEKLFDLDKAVPVSKDKGSDPGALAGLKVLEFGGYAAGPHIGKLLANFGATVVHVESRARPDGFRLEYPPFKDNEPGADRGGCFTYFNDSKYGITLDLKHEAGLRLAIDLSGWADVIVENMRPGVMARLGLGFEKLKTINPRLVMLSTCNMGQSGPRANTPGFGSQLSAHAGFCGLTGEAEGLPMLLYGPYIDFVASVMGSAAVLAGLEHRRRTGMGVLIDQSQFESGLHFISGALFEFSQTGRVAVRRGNCDPIAAPHGAYRCKNDAWIALSCWSDTEFERLCIELGAPGLAADAKFQYAQARRNNRPELNTALSQLTENLDCAALMSSLQSAGVHAHMVNTIVDLFDDAQLAHDRAWRRRPHPVIGPQSYCFPGFDLSRTPGDIVRAGPMLGADNETVICEMLGKTREEFKILKTMGAFD